MKPRFRYLVPVHNESSIIENTVDKLVAKLKLFPESEIVLLENGSSDTSAALCQKLAETREGVKITSFQLAEAGLGCAYQAGLDYSLESPEEAVCVLTAADLPFEFSDLDGYLKASYSEKESVLIGSKSHSASEVHRPWARKILSFGFWVLRWVLLGMRTQDCQGAFFLSTGQVKALRPLLRSKGFFITTELAYFAENQGIGTVEIPVQHKDSGKPSTVRPVRDSWRMVCELFRLKSRSFSHPVVSFSFFPVRLLEWLVAVLLGITAFGYFFGFSILNPVFFSWLMNGDAASHLLGWWYFRAGPWSFPLGSLPGFPAPVGSHLLQSDSIPVVGVVAKLFSQFLTPSFHYFGWWLFSCYLLQSLFAYRIFALLTPNFLLRLLSSAFLVFCPVLLFRSGHLALCAHWVVLFHLYVSMKLARTQGRAALPWKSFFAVNFLLSGVHPYLLAMSLTLTLSSIFMAFRLRTGAQVGELLSKTVGLLVVVGVGAGSLGYFSVSEPAADNWGYLSADLLTFINSQGVSNWVPRIRNAGVIEGFAYLGVGLIALAIYNFAARRKHREHFLFATHSWFAWPYFLGVIALAVYALSPRVKFGGNAILFLDFFYYPLGKLPDIFRATGRFIWPLYYLVCIRILAAVITIHSVRKATILLLLALFLHFGEMHTWFHSTQSRTGEKQWNQFRDPKWTKLASHASSVALVPPILPTESGTCALDTQAPYGVFISSAVLSAQAGKSFNSCYTSRLAWAKVSKYCTQFLNEWKEGRAQKGVLYVVQDSWMPAPHSLKCEKLDGVWACF